MHDNHDAGLTVRREREADEPAIHQIHALAFARGAVRGPVAEAMLVNRLRNSDAWIPGLSIVAVEDELVVGSVVCSRAWIDPAALPVIGLGPLGVHPERQGRGIGSALVRAGIAAAVELEEVLIGLLGDPGYYARFGFRPSRTFLIEPPDPRWEDNFQALPLTGSAPVPEGTFRYAPPFDDL